MAIVRRILGWRKMTYVLWAWTIIFGIWIIAGSSSGVSQANKDCATNHGVLSVQACQDASHAGTAIGAFLIFLLWLIGFLVLSIVWFMTRPKGRECPHCGERVKKGRTACKCGYDFVIGGRPMAQPVPTPQS